MREWVYATEGNTGAGIVIDCFQGSFSDFTALYTDFTPEGYLGSWGVDVATSTVWAVINHNSEFAVVPEPATLSAIGALGLFMMRRRRAALAKR